MPSKSKSQQKFMGMVHALQKGEIDSDSVSDKIKKVAGSIDYDDAEDFASTKHKGLPNKIKRETRVMSLIRKMVREIMSETTVRISTMKDATFHRDIVQLLGKKGKVSLDKKSVSALVKIIRSGSPGSGMGRSFTTFDGYDPKQKNEAKLNEAKTHRLPNGVKVKVEFKGITLKGRHNPVFLDRTEMMRFFKATHKYLKTKRLENQKLKKEGFGGELSPSKKKKFEKTRKGNAEVLGYKLTGESDIKEGKGTPLWNKNNVKKVIKQIQKGIKVPYADGLGLGALSRHDEHPSILGKISVDAKKDWPNGYIENSRWALVRIDADGTIDTVRMNGYSDFKTRKKVPILRKSKNKNLRQIIDRLGKYFTVVRLKHPDTK